MRPLLLLIAEAVKAARSGRTIEVGPGTYHEAVEITLDWVTLRGTDRNAVVLDGRFKLLNGVFVSGNVAAFEYGTGHDGLIQHSLASGHPNSGFYIGQCRPCDVTIVDMVAERNAIGYDGTNAFGGVVVAVVMGIALEAPENSLLIQHTARSEFVRTDRLQDRAVDVLRYGEWNRSWAADGGTHLVRFEGIAANGAAPTIVDLLEVGPVEVSPARRCSLSGWPGTRAARR
ncbi:MAG: hypothetical protein FJW83_03625 [Actinobacteria bacterium]|nr:hypothetical protein [Actinomycetota bacterium]